MTSNKSFTTDRGSSLWVPLDWRHFSRKHPIILAPKTSVHRLVNDLKPACHIALFPVPRDFNQSENLSERLSLGEKSRLASFKLPQRRQQYILGRLLLKDLAGTMFGINNPEILHRAGGAPYLAQNDAEFNCSLSHSGPYLLAGLSSCGALGIDIEHYQPRQMSRLVDHYFHPDEQIRFHQLSESDQADYFFRLWTCKEALAKQSGEGIKLGKLKNAVSGLADRLYLLQGDDYCGAIASELEPLYWQANWQAIWQKREFVFTPLPEPKPVRL